MLEITIHVTGLEKLADAIISLSGERNLTTVPAAGMGMDIPIGAAQIPQTPTPALMSGQTMLGAVPTSTVPQEYTQDQIAIAMTGLSDQGKRADLINILARFGVASLVQVPKERYPELVLLLREAGAAI